jgi:hypothetical protein
MSSSIAKLQVAMAEFSQLLLRGRQTFSKSRDMVLALLFPLEAFGS